MSEINLKRNISFTTGSQAITMAASFIVNMFLARLLGPELRGQYVYLFTLNSFIWMLLDLGVSKSIMYSLQREKADPKAIYSMSLVVFGISFVFSLIFFQLFFNRLIGENAYRPIIVFALSSYINFFLLHNRQKVMSIGTNRIVDYSLQLILPTIIFMALLLPLFWLFPKHLKMDYSYLLNVSVMLLVVIIFHFRLSKQIDFKFVWDGALVKKSYRLGFNAFLSEFMLVMMTRVDIIMLKKISSFADVGIYMLAINFIDIINVTGNMIGVVLLNKFSALNNDEESLLILRKIFLLMSIFNLICILLMVVFGQFVIKIVYTDLYLGSYMAFMFLVPAIFGLTLGSLFNTFLWSKGFPAFTIMAPALATALKLSLSYLFIGKMGYLGAALSSSIVYPLWVLSLLIWYFGTHKELKLSCLMIRKQDFVEMVGMVRVLLSKVRGNNESCPDQ